MWRYAGGGSPAVLWNTAWIEGAVIAGVVIVDAGRRKLRRTRRAR
jgi:hypothetical protein